MANVNIDIDTSKKTFSVTVDGKKVSDVNEAYVVKHGEYFELSVVSIDDSTEDLRRVTRLMANEKGDLIDHIEKIPQFNVNDLFLTRSPDITVKIT